MPSVATRVFGVAAIILGASGLYFHGFATLWQPIFLLTRDSTNLSYIANALLVAGGIAVQIPQTARAGVIAVCSLEVLFALLWLPRMLHWPMYAGPFTAAAQDLAPAVAGYALLRPSRAATILFAICVALFGIGHLAAVAPNARLVPPWMVGSPRFWVIFSGLGFIFAAVAITINFEAVTVTRILMLVFALFAGIVWLPLLVIHPQAHNVWAGTAINLFALASAWMVGDAIASLAPANRAPQQAHAPNA